METTATSLSDLKIKLDTTKKELDQLYLTKEANPLSMKDGNSELYKLHEQWCTQILDKEDEMRLIRNELKKHE